MPAPWSLSGPEAGAEVAAHRDPIRGSDVSRVYQFAGAANTKYDRLGRLKPQKFIFTHFWRLEGRDASRGGCVSCGLSPQLAYLSPLSCLHFVHLRYLLEHQSDRIRALPDGLVFS